MSNSNMRSPERQHRIRENVATLEKDNTKKYTRIKSLLGECNFR